MQIQKPRMFQSTKDIVLTLGVLFFAMFITVGFTGLCSFNPGPADRSGPVREVDAKTFLSLEASSVGYEIVYPTMPEGWVANSARRTQVGKHPGSLVGWVINGERYISLTQTSADLKEAVQRGGHVRQETGTENIGGLEWHKFKDEDVDPLWIADCGDHRLILEAAATEAQMRTAAERVAQAEPLKNGK